MSHALLPLMAYAALALSARGSCAHAHTREVVFVVGAATLLLLFVGIHNAWDAVAYHVFVSRRDTHVEPRWDKTIERSKR